MLLAGLAFPAEELAFGHTKIFIRSPRTVSLGMGGSIGIQTHPGSSWVMPKPLELLSDTALVVVVPSSLTWSGSARSVWPSSPPSSRKRFGAGGAGPSTS